GIVYALGIPPWRRAARWDNLAYPPKSPFLGLSAPFPRKINERSMALRSQLLDNLSYSGRTIRPPIPIRSLQRCKSRAAQPRGSCRHSAANGRNRHQQAANRDPPEGDPSPSSPMRLLWEHRVPFDGEVRRDSATIEEGRIVSGMFLRLECLDCSEI